MKRFALVLLLSAFGASPVYAQACKAVGSDGKPLAGAAKARG